VTKSLEDGVVVDLAAVAAAAAMVGAGAEVG
jgi:hypothetical protein